MIITEIVTINGREFMRTTSDENRYVVRDGMAYCEAVDPIDSNRVYIEGDIMDEDVVDLEHESQE